ncbi:IS4 family transposase, partial [Paenibacillus filicis]|nr:IS4 family transposase [Paenibacillus filicis]
MIEQKEPCNQLPKEIKPAFKELQVLKHLKDAKINKKFGFTAAYLFQLVFVLLFHQKNWFRLLESTKAESFPGKDSVYRFLNHTKFAWRQFLLSLSAATVQKVELLTSDNRVT